MKQIQTLNLWKNGQQTQANYLALRIVHDDLSNLATFYYYLQTSEESGILIDGNITISGQEYEQWGESINVNEDAWTIVATKLNLQLV